MRVPARIIGVMTLVAAESKRRLTQEDLELAEQLGRRAAVAVENARLHTALSRVADTLQQSLLPDELPEVPGWELAAHYSPAGGEQRIDVGGDFYDVFTANGEWFAVIGDVTGKGVEAAALTSLLRHGSRFASRHDPSPAALLAQLDEALKSGPAESLCTALCVRLHGGRLVISSAGHPPALVVASDGAIREVPNPGPLLGAFADARWSDEEVPLTPDEMLLLYTDGVSDASGDGERFGVERIKSVLRESASAAPAELLARLDRALEQFRGDPHGDDVATLALRRR
jgi:serine phosphatase RsbU (regulator of sigma subunit)